MFIVPEEIKELLHRDSCQKNIRIHFPNGERSDICNDMIIKDSVKLTESLCSQNELKFGLCESPTFECSVVGCENVKGASIEVFCEVYCDASVEDSVFRPDLQAYVYPIQYGKFIISDCKRDADMQFRNIVAYGQSAYQNFKINPNDVIGGSSTSGMDITDYLSVVLQNIEFLENVSEIEQVLSPSIENVPLQLFEYLTGGISEFYIVNAHNKVVVGNPPSIDYGVHVKLGNQIFERYSDIELYNYRTKVPVATIRRKTISLEPGLYRVDCPKESLFDAISQCIYLSFEDSEEEYRAYNSLGSGTYIYSLGSHYPDNPGKMTNLGMDGMALEKTKNDYLGRVGASLLNDKYIYVIARTNLSIIESVKFKIINDYAMYSSDMPLADFTVSEDSIMRANLFPEDDAGNFNTEVKIPAFSGILTSLSIALKQLSSSNFSNISEKINIALEDNILWESDEISIDYEVTKIDHDRIGIKYSDAMNLKTREWVTSIFELSGYFLIENRSGTAVVRRAEQIFYNHPDENIYPGENTYPQGSYGGKLLPEEYQTCWYDDEYSLPYGKIYIPYYTGSSSSGYTQYELERYINGFDSDSDESTYRVYDLSQNAYLNYSFQYDDGTIYRSTFTFTQIKKFADNIEEGLKHAVYLPAEVIGIGLPYVEAGDTLEVLTKSNDSITTIVLNRTISGEQVLTDTYKSN